MEEKALYSWESPFWRRGGAPALNTRRVYINIETSLVSELPTTNVNLLGMER